MLDGKKVQKAFHVTTLYLGRDACKDPVLLRQLVGLLGESIELTLTSVASDPKGTAIAVRNEGESPAKMFIHTSPSRTRRVFRLRTATSCWTIPMRMTRAAPSTVSPPAHVSPGHLSSGGREGHCGARRWLQWHPLPPHAGLVGAGGRGGVSTCFVTASPSVVHDVPTLPWRPRFPHSVL
ncbi:hypothetical protein C3747_265g11 [Trypanosoma cruzi]|uniref:Uncharacterized protein n=1 Tax=Trypanosoma cruzi TaxID=5693 RepID=A0A2V2VH24_TRYCR|nr:hypothetical protein C3747_265g11 [Trypanosoma cruzi]